MTTSEAKHLAYALKRALDESGVIFNAPMSLTFVDKESGAILKVYTDESTEVYFKDGTVEYERAKYSTSALAKQHDARYHEMLESADWESDDSENSKSVEAAVYYLRYKIKCIYNVIDKFKERMSKQIKFDENL